MIVTITFDDSTHKLVPIEPTPEMNKAGYAAKDLWSNYHCDNQKEVEYSFSMPRWKAMVKAAPEIKSGWED